MTPAEINAAIAEILGIKAVCNFDSGLWHLVGNGLEYGRGMGVSEEHAWLVCCPDYFHDLNAIHEAEEHLEARDISDLYGPDKAAEYHAALDHLSYKEMLGSIRATAPQRCEAFLRAHGKWRGE